MKNQKKKSYEINQRKLDTINANIEIKIDGTAIEADEPANGISVLFAFASLHPCPAQIKHSFPLEHRLVSDKQPRSISFSAKKRMSSI